MAFGSQVDLEPRRDVEVGEQCSVHRDQAKLEPRRDAERLIFGTRRQDPAGDANGIEHEARRDLARRMRRTRDKLMPVRQQAVGTVEFGLDERCVAEAQDAHHFLDAEPQRLAILERQDDIQPDVDAAELVAVVSVGREVLGTLGDVLVEGQQVLGAERLQGIPSLGGPFGVPSGIST